MLKYIIGVFIVMFLAFGVFYAYFSRGLFINLRPNAPISTTFRAEGTSIVSPDTDGLYQPLVFRGVEISPAIPGKRTWDFGAGIDDYLRWFGYIDAMGANALYVTTIMDPDFYNALYRFNTGNERPLLILQGVHGSTYRELTFELRRAIDIIHGRRIHLFYEGGIKVFLQDISRWLIGFVVGTEFDPDAIAYMNLDLTLPDSFKGQFFATSKEASRFEVMLAQVMEYAVSHQTRRYRIQRPIGFIAGPTVDFLEYAWAYATQLRKYVQLDHENIIPTEDMKAGTFAAYRLYYLTADFHEYLTIQQRLALTPILNYLDHDCIFNGYLDLLARHHTMPVMATGFGFSSSRVQVRTDAPPLNEAQQGENLVTAVTQLAERGWTGSFISTWQDTWERRTWNSAFSSNPWRYQYWHNLQSAAQGYGLMAFEPGMYARPVLIDGVADEWDQAHLVHSHDGINIYAQYTTQGLYLLIRGDGVNPQNTLYLPIDVTPQSGNYSFYDLQFARPSDFLIILSGKDNSHMMVSRRYHATYNRFYEEKTGTNPFSAVPPRWDSGFVPITLALPNPVILPTPLFASLRNEGREMRRLRSWEAGALTHGIGDPASPYFNSLADFYFGDNLVEIRLPWMLLNFFDPSLMQVHDDFFDRFGVEGLAVEYIHIGLRAGDAGMILMSPIPLNGWDNQVEFHERLKQSYFIIKEAWGRTCE